jgi:hypothetical protein
VFSSRFLGTSIEGEKTMNQSELNRAVAKATGETVAVISSLGFVPLTEKPHEREPQFVDWVNLQIRRTVSTQPRRRRAPAIA